MITKRSLLAMLTILTLVFNAFAQKKKDSVNTLPKIRIALDGGYSIRTAKSAESLDAQSRDYFNAMRNGTNIGIEAAYFFSPSWSAGIKYNNYTSTTGYRTFVLSNGNSGTATLEEQAFIDYVAATTSTQYASKNGKHLLMFGLGLGYMKYTYRLKVGTETGRGYGGTVGANFDLNYDLRLGKSFGIGPKISYLGGAVKEFKTNTGETITLEGDDKESLSRFDFSIGLRFYM